MLRTAARQTDLSVQPFQPPHIYIYIYIWACSLVERHPLPRLGQALLVVVLELQFLRKTSVLMLLRVTNFDLGSIVFCGFGGSDMMCTRCATEMLWGLSTCAPPCATCKALRLVSSFCRSFLYPDQRASNSCTCHATAQVWTCDVSVQAVGACVLHATRMLVHQGV